MRLPARFAVLAERDFRLFFAGNVVSLTGDYMLPVALSFAVLEKYDEPGALGTVLTAHSLPLVLLLLFGGVVADRLPRRTVLMASDGASCVVQACAAALLLTGAGSSGTSRRWRRCAAGYTRSRRRRTPG